MTKDQRRQAKFKETETYVYWNQNPKKVITTDCVIRALSLGLDLPYEQVVMELAEQQCKYGFDDGDPKAIARYLKSKGWIKCKQPRNDDNTRMTGREFCMKLVHPIYCEELTNLPRFCRIDSVIANVGSHHIVAIKNGKIHDTWNCSENCVGNVWVRMEV